MRRYFKFTDDINTINNIAYRNETCNTVSKTIRKLSKNQNDFEKNETLVCRQYAKIKGGVFHVNYEYKIVKIKDDFIGLRDASDNSADVIVIPKSLAKHNLFIVIAELTTLIKGQALMTILFFLIGTLSM